MAGYGYSYPYDRFRPRKAEGGPYQYPGPGTYIMKVEAIVERVHPPVLPESYRQCSPPRYEHPPSYGGQHGPSIPTNDRPPVVEEFPNKIQNEVSHQPFGFSAPRAPYQLRTPDSPGYRGTPGNAGDSDHDKGRQKVMTNTMKGEDPKADKILKPPVTTEGGNRPRPGNPAGSVLPSHPISYEREPTIQPQSTTMAGRRERRGPNMELSKPTNDIYTATEYLKKVADPYSVNTIKDEAPDPSHLKGDKIPKPPVATEGGPAARPGHPRGSMLPNYYIPSEREERTIQPPSKTVTGGWERRGPDMGLEPRQTGRAVEYSKEAVKPPPGSTVLKRDSNPETIDSNEARRRYGNLNPAPEQYSTGNASTINSREAAKKYNGQFV